jgi:hypothetical protein
VPAPPLPLPSASDPFPTPDSTPGGKNTCRKAVIWLPRDDAVPLVVVLVGRVAVVAARGLRGLVNVPPLPRCCNGGGGAAAVATRLSLWNTLTLAGAARGGRTVASHVPVLKSQVCPQRRAADHS